MLLLSLLSLSLAATNQSACAVPVKDVGYTESYYAVFANTSQASCCAKCDADPKCFAWSWHTKPFKTPKGTGNCLVDDKATPHASTGAISGAKGPVPTPGAPTPPPTITPTPPPIHPDPPTPSGKQPNIVLFLQDDQDKFLGGWEPMTQADKLLVQGGAEATNCPSRAEILSGRYFHNVRETTSSGGCMHIDTNKVNPVSFAMYLGKAGYTVGYFGKHMNSCPHTPPPGFDCPTCYWFANGGGKDTEPGGYLNASFSEFAQNLLPGDTNGTYKANTNGEYAGYTTSIIANKSIEWIKRVAKGDKPFMVTVASKGPHVPSTPAPWYETGTYIDNLTAPRTPDYNASKEILAHHHWLIAQQGPITEVQGGTIDALFRNRWRTLLSVDDAIVGVHQAIQELGLVDNTYYFITSDHGYNLGQHRLPSCKLNVYDHDIRIPMVIKGPGIPAGLKFDQPASNVDVAPTLLAVAGVYEYAQNMDGRSVLPLIINTTDPATPPTVRQHVLEQRLQQRRSAGDLGVTASEVDGSGIVAFDWRDHHFVEYYSLGKVERTGHLVDDPDSNTYRALRFTSGKHGHLLYAEFTAVKDWHFQNVSFHEMFDMDADPHQLHNIYDQASDDLKKELAAEVAKQWGCEGQVGDNACP